MKIKTSAIVLCAVAAFALHAANPADSKTPDKKQNSNVVFTEDFETKNNKSWAVRPGYVFQRGEGVDATGGLSLSRPDAAAAYTSYLYAPTSSAQVGVQSMTFRFSYWPLTSWPQRVSLRPKIRSPSLFSLAAWMAAVSPE